MVGGLSSPPLPLLRRIHPALLSYLPVPYPRSLSQTSKGMSKNKISSKQDITYEVGDPVL